MWPRWLLFVQGEVTMLFLRLPAGSLHLETFLLEMEMLSAASLPVSYFCCIMASSWRRAQHSLWRVPGCQSLPDVPSPML